MRCEVVANRPNRRSFRGSRTSRAHLHPLFPPRSQHLKVLQRRADTTRMRAFLYLSVVLAAMIAFGATASAATVIPGDFAASNKRLLDAHLRGSATKRFSKPAA